MQNPAEPLQRKQNDSILSSPGELFSFPNQTGRLAIRSKGVSLPLRVQRVGPHLLWRLSMWKVVQLISDLH
jgi:hypothetical protein